MKISRAEQVLILISVQLSMFKFDCFVIFGRLEHISISENISKPVVYVITNACCSASDLELWDQRQ